MQHIVRCELNNASSIDYENLHRSMATKGLQREILANDGYLYRLPTGTYFANSPASTQAIALAAEQAAQQTGHTSEIVVSSTDHPVHMRGLTKLRRAS